MSQRKPNTWLTPLVVTAALVGCAHKSEPPTPGSEIGTTKEQPINAQTRYAAGQLAEGQNRLEQAVTQYQESLKLDPNYQPALYRLGVVYAQLKRYPDAIQAWEKYIRITGGASEAYSNLGFCQELAGSPAAAEAAYKQGIARDPKSQPCRINYGLMLARHGHVNEAVFQLQAVLPPGKAHYDIGSVLQMQGRKLEARREYQKAIELDPSLSDAKAKLAALD